VTSTDRPWIIYLRLSDFRGDPDGFGPREDRLRAEVARLGGTVARIATENDLTPAANGRSRPASAFKRRKVTLPGGPLTLLQIAIGIVDLGCCAAAMYMLVPDEPNLGFVTVAVIFVAATLLGFASHAPGGLGVFDAAMMVGMWQFDKEDLLAGLLLFRLLYYIIPFVISLVILGVRELLLGRAARRATQTAPPLDAEGVREKSDLVR